LGFFIVVNAIRTESGFGGSVFSKYMAVDLENSYNTLLAMYTSSLKIGCIVPNKYEVSFKPFPVILQKIVFSNAVSAISCPVDEKETARKNKK